MLRLFLALFSIGTPLTACGGEIATPQPDPITLRLEVSHVSSFGGTDGSVDLEISGGMQPFEFEWSHGAQSEDVSGLSVGIYRVTVTDAAGQSESESATVLQPPQDTGSVSDLQGIVYRTVRIGDQWWMAENLRVTVDPEGNPIQSSDNAEYGHSYTWEVIMHWSTDPKARGICPAGWHVPDEDEWNELFETLGGIEVAGGKLKEPGTEHWRSPNTEATNASGFTALPDPFGEGAYQYTHFHTSSGQGVNVILPSLAYNLAEAYVLNWVDNDNFLSTVRHSVRCVRN